MDDSDSCLNSTPNDPKLNARSWGNRRNKPIMDTINQNQDEVQVRLTVDEVVAISNGLNEALESLEEWEFHVRMGVTRSEAEGLLEAFREITTR